MNKEEINKYYPEELTTEILDELWLDMCFTKDYIKHKYEFYKLRDSYYLLQQENKKYKEVIDKAINNSQYWIDYYTRLNSDERIALRLQENIDILKEVK